MRMLPLMTLMSFVIGNEVAGLRNILTDKCSCNQHLHTYVALMDVKLRNTFCGASVINQKQVLTLASCVFDKKITDYKVVVDPYPGHDEIAYRVESVVFHSENSTTDSDIALVTIAKRFKPYDKDFPFCLPFRYSNDTMVDKRATSLAWDRKTLPDGTYTDVRYRRSPIVSENIECNDGDQYRNSTILCNELKHRGSAYYNGGEPVLWRCLETQVLMQIGIVVSRMSPDGHNHIFMLAISSFLDWIEDNLPTGLAYCELGIDT